ncbi:BadF/BadG/BcrA/BcrD ATPase family protein [Luteimicrobium sp. NPDC057192]|uniref:BadF/BadG/BcrA/BcrD ATPase family protein n=1 Tax=Luteimicrobium sp. NPDC057192 TaxID=3346042 RepID=UPI00362CDF1F
MTGVAGVDLGKTSCRVVVRDTDGVRVGKAPGAPGLASPDGVGRAVDAVLAGLRAAGTGPGAVSVCVGAAGALAAPAAAARLADALAAACGGRVAVTSDATVAHAGAFAGRAGTVVAVGTGTVLVELDDAGTLRTLDGWGPWLGDDGSGSWLGRAGLRAVLCAAEGRGEPTALTGRAADWGGAPAAIPGLVAASDAPARTLASFAPHVLASARDGDAVAGAVVADAVRAVADACAHATPPYALVGGITTAEPFGSALRAALGPKHVVAPEPAPPDGARVEPALRGALLLATDPTTPYERTVSRRDPV